MTSCDDTTFSNVRFNTTTPLQIFGVYKIATGQFAGVCGQVLNVAPPCLACDDVNPTLYDDCSDCLGITPPPQQVCTVIDNTNPFVSYVYTYTFNGIVYSNQPINGGQSVTICAEVGSAFGSSEDVTVFEGNTTCTSDASCAADDVCREYDIFNSSIIEQGSYKYRDCSGVNRIEVILPGQTYTICSQTPPRVATSDQAFVFVTALGFCS